MKKISTFSLSLIVAGTLAWSPAYASVGKTLPVRYNGPVVNIPGMRNHTPQQLTLEKLGIKPAGVSYAASRVADGQPVATAMAPGFGFIDGPDGSQWYYTQTFEAGSQGFTKSTVTIFDSTNKQAGKFDVEVPEGKSVNSIEVFGSITKKLFDKNDKSLEALVSMHITGNRENNYKSTYITRAYHIDGSGIAYEGVGMAMLFDASEGWNTYQRMLLVNDIVNDDESETIKIDVVAPAGWGDEGPKVEHTFNIDFDLWNYSQGSYLNCFVVDGQPYYVVSKYEKPYVTGYDDDYEMIVNEDNKYVLTTYDRNYNQVDSIAVPIVKPSDTLYRFGAFGIMSVDDLSKNYYTTDGKFNYVLAWADYNNSDDETYYDFAVYDSEGNKVKDICQDAMSNQWFTLKSIPGQSEQMAFYHKNAAGEQEVLTMDVPSCVEATVFPAEIDGEGITTTLDRYPSNKNAEGYQYLVNMQNGTTDDKGNVLAQMSWYNPDLTLDHKVKINLGQEGEYFTPLINSTSLNPYLFDTDDQLEYIYIAKKRRTDGTNKIDNVLEIAKEDGTILRSFNGDGDMRFRTASLLQMDGTRNQLFVANYNDDTEEWGLNFYDLPFTKFTKGGDGTAQNPYLISTVGDMQQIAAATDASYRVADDIDFAAAPSLWTPIAQFSGNLDGDGHKLSNLSIATESSNAGLFAQLDPNATVSNLSIVDPEIETTTSNTNVGVLAGSAAQASISDVHIYNANIHGNGDAVTGGVVGEAALNSAISRTSFSGTVNMPKATTAIGGIVGDARTGCDINTAYAKLTAYAESSIGGIAGNINNDTKLTNCRADVALTATHTIGGIVGASQRGPIDKCVASGFINATGQQWGRTAAGGIVGSLQGDWNNYDDESKVVKPVSNSFSGVTLKYDADKSVAATIHNIAGYTSVNEETWDDEEPTKEAHLANNYTWNEEGADDANYTDGKFQKADGAGKAFFESLGYAYGNSVESPWSEIGDQFLPSLFYVDNLLGIHLGTDKLVMEQGSKKEVTVSVNGIEAESLSTAVSDPTVASVQLSGNSIEVTALKEGSTVITVKSGNYTADIHVYVGDVTAISGTASDTTVKSTTFIDLSGRTVKTPQHGVFIKRMTMTDGSVKTVKVVVK